MKTKGKEWRLQKGNPVYYAVDRASGQGIVEKVIASAWFQDYKFLVRTEDGRLIEVPIRSIRALKD
jgi:hypothetical protein